MCVFIAAIKVGMYKFVANVCNKFLCERKERDLKKKNVIFQKSSSKYDMLILNGDFTKDYKQDTHKFLLFQIKNKKTKTNQFSPAKCQYL